MCPHLQGGTTAWILMAVPVYLGDLGLFLESRCREQALSIFSPLGIASWVLRNHICQLVKPSLAPVWFPWLAPLGLAAINNRAWARIRALHSKGKWRFILLESKRKISSASSGSWRLQPSLMLLIGRSFCKIPHCELFSLVFLFSLLNLENFGKRTLSLLTVLKGPVQWH